MAGRETWASLLSLSWDAHTLTPPRPLLPRLGRGSAGRIPGCMASLAAGYSPWRAQDLHPGNGGLQRPSVTDLCDQLPRSCKKQEPGTGHPRPPWVQAPQLPGLGSVPSRGVPGASPERSEEPPGLPLPSPRLRARPRIHVRRSIVAPAFSSNGLCQSEQPREQSEQEAAAGPKLQKLLLGALGLREGRAPSMQCPPCCLGTSQTWKRAGGCTVGRRCTTGYTHAGTGEPANITRRACIWKVWSDPTWKKFF